MVTILDQLKPCAVIVEEAAEIIEGQLISVLPPTIQHLVMLGDQEQLQPRVNCYKLTQKHLDCSMFERLINNKMPFKQLGKQCRMRDDIAELLRSLNIYEALETNKEVGLTHSFIKLCCSNASMFFLPRFFNFIVTDIRVYVHYSEITKFMHINRLPCRIHEFVKKNGVLD
jgi:hypothetical protein